MTKKEQQLNNNLLENYVEAVKKQLGRHEGHFDVLYPTTCIWANLDFIAEQFYISDEDVEDEEERGDKK